MGKVFRGNLYFLIILLIEIFAPMFLSPVFYRLGIPMLGVLVLNHVCLFIIPAIFYFIITRESVKDTLRLNPISIKEGLLAILIGILSQPVVLFFSVVTSFFFPNKIAVVINHLSSAPYIVMLLVIAVMPAITEEITIRGIVLSGYDNKGIIKSAIITGLMFGMFHLTASQFLYATVLGALFAYMVRITNSIFVSALTHFTINGIQITIQKFSAHTSNEELVRQANKLLNQSLVTKLTIGVFYGILAIIFAYIIYRILQKMKEQANFRGVKYNQSNVQFFGGANSNPNERIVDIPFIISVAVYLMYMCVTLFR